MSQLHGFTSDSSQALPLYLLEREQLAGWCASQPPAVAAWVAAQQFHAEPARRAESQHCGHDGG